ncbi:UDP-glycosyltransferase 75C1 [Camellia lanceoleosa]|uniref:UDP-glycosyltransferase 75C1 n=1 Tax=Camellia lanceoleosa TaxID=1840588 RepID=A0ACC0GWI2_9ERIC|nr:UDP-glycosyltransferase 75C1 [Camellia lanceoleosa]
MVMESEEMRRNAKKCKVMAREAVKEGGSSDVNLKAFPITQEIEQRLTVEIEQRVTEKLKVEFEQIRAWMDFIRSQGGPSGIQLPNASSGRQEVRKSVRDHDSHDDELLGSPVQVLHED